MAANNMKCLSFITTITVFISIVQAGTTFEANHTLTKIPEAYSNKYKVETGPQPKALLDKSVVTTFEATKITKGLEQYEYLNKNDGIKSSTTQKGGASKLAKKFKKYDSHKKLLGSGSNDKSLNRLKSNSSKKSPDIKSYDASSLSTLKPSSLNKNVGKVQEPSELKDAKTVQNGKASKNVKKKFKAADDAKKVRAKREADDMDQIETYGDTNKYADEGCQPADVGDTSKFFKAMDKLNAMYAKAIIEFVKQMGTKFDEEMFKVMLFNRSVSERALFNAKGVSKAVPAGLQLGGYGLLNLTNSLLFFHRMKLRNNTSFLLSYIKSDFKNMELKSQIHLGDLHLQGNYERLMVEKNPDNLFYAPTYGSLSILLRNVNYTMTGRYRVANGRLLVEEIISQITGKDAIVVYQKVLPRQESSVHLPSPFIKLDKLADFLDRIKIDLNHWVKDYFNDYLTYFGLASKRANEQFQKYDKQKTMIHNDLADHVVRMIRWKLNVILPYAEPNIAAGEAKHLTFKLPDFSITVVNGMTLKCANGVVQGLNSIYRRSTANGASYADHAILRNVDSMIGFSDLKVVYKYEASTPEGPPMQGQLILTADDLSAHLRIEAYRKLAYHLQLDEIQPMKVQSLTIEGPVSRMIGSYKHVLENHIVALLVNFLVAKVKELDVVFKCGALGNTLDPPPKLKDFDQVEPYDDNHLNPGEPDDDDFKHDNAATPSDDILNGRSNENAGHQDGLVEPNDGTLNGKSDENAGHQDGLVEPNDDILNSRSDENVGHQDGLVEPNDDILNGRSDENINVDDGVANHDANEENRSPAIEHVDRDDNQAGNQADLGVEKSDSIDLELPEDSQHHEPRQVHVDFKQQYKVYERKVQNSPRRFVGRQELAKKGGKHSRSELLLSG